MPCILILFLFCSCGRDHRCSETFNVQAEQHAQLQTITPGLSCSRHTALCKRWRLSIVRVPLPGAYWDVMACAESLSTTASPKIRKWFQYGFSCQILGLQSITFRSPSHRVGPSRIAYLEGNLAHLSAEAPFPVAFHRGLPAIFVAPLLAIVSASVSVHAWSNPFPVEPCHGVDIKDITVARLQEVRV